VVYPGQESNPGGGHDGYPARNSLEYDLLPYTDSPHASLPYAASPYEPFCHTMMMKLGLGYG